MALKKKTTLRASAAVSPTSRRPLVSNSVNQLYSTDLQSLSHTHRPHSLLTQTGPMPTHERAEGLGAFLGF
jgi:hypothetical protein